MAPKIGTKVKNNVFALGLVSLLTDVSSQMIYPLLPLFLESVLGVNKVFIGLIEGVAESTASITRVFSGWLSDRLGKRKPLVFAGYSLSTVGKPFLYLAASGWHVLGVRFIERLGKGIRTPARDALIADSTGGSSMGWAFGFHRAMDRLGAVLGPLLAFVLLPLVDNDYRYIFLLAFIPGLLAVLLVVTAVKEGRDRPQSELKLARAGFKQLGPRFRYLTLITALFTLGNSSDAFLILRARQLGISAGLIPVLWLVYNLTCSLCSAPGGVLSDRIGRKRTVLSAFGVYGVVYLGFAFAGRTWQMWGLFVLYGLYGGLSEGVLRAYVADIVPVRARASAYGIYHATLGLAVLPASLIMGFLWQYWGAVPAFSWGAGLALISAVLLKILL